jgi:ATP-dependent helicase/nuclease subunit A
VSAQSTGGALADQVARDRIRGDFDTTLIVEASAGTGKTTELVHRILALLRSGKGSLDRIVALTFTDPAAGEMKLRLRAAIEHARHDPRTPPAERARLTAALPLLEEARIATIHSFCVDLLRKYPIEAGVDPLFEVAAEDAESQLVDRVFDRWLESQLTDPGPGVRRVLRRTGERDGPRGLLRSAAQELIRRRDFPTPWRHATRFDRPAEMEALLAEMSALAEWAERGDPGDYFTRSLVELAKFVAEVRRAETLRGRDHDGLEAELATFAHRWHSHWVGYARGADGFPKENLKQRRDAVRARLDAYLESAGAELAPLLRDDLWPIVDAYDRAKAQAGRLDFLDLLLRTRDLVRDRADVREALQSHFSHLLIDEFQDTDPLQAELLLLLAADDSAISDWTRAHPAPGKLFLVGDPKQAIYRFRRADVALYESVKRSLLASGAALIELTVSFRAVPEIQQAVNSAFTPLMRGETDSQARYVPLSPDRPSCENQPAVVALPVPAPYGDYRKVVHRKLEESLPDTIAAFVAWIVQKSGWTVTERENPGKRVPIRPRHVCVLFKRFQSFGRDLTRSLVVALEARRLPHLLVGGSSFHSREEIEAVRNALAAIERPEDELMVFATLRGPLFALSDAALLAWRHRVGGLHPFRHVPEPLPDPLRDVAEALAILAALHRDRNQRPIAETIASLLAAVRAHAGIAIWPTGEQALANVARLLDLARRGERRGVTSFRAFVEWCVSQAERGQAGDAPIFEEGTEGVRMMTVHKAKGLEFPVVILADMTASDVPRHVSRWVDSAQRLCAMRLAECTPPELEEHEAEELEREREEAKRVLYVAATRARDLLVVPVVGDARCEGWLSALNPVVYPAPDRAGERSEAAPGCPPFGSESVPFRPDNVMRPHDSVVPGLHRPEVGTHTVVWWDPLILELNVQESVGQAQQHILETDEGGVRSDEGLRMHAEWQERRAALRAKARTPAVTIVTAIEYATASAVPPSPVVIVSVAVDGPRPRGARFGSLVHALLATVDLRANEIDVRERAAALSRAFGAPDEEIDAAIVTVTRALAHPLLLRASSAAEVRREVPVQLRGEAGILIEGVVDLAFRELDPKAAWTVIDFKTDAEIDGREEIYRRQIQLYAEAMRLSSGHAVEAILLRV